MHGGPSIDTRFYCRAGSRPSCTLVGSLQTNHCTYKWISPAIFKINTLSSALLRFLLLKYNLEHDKVSKFNRKFFRSVK